MASTYNEEEHQPLINSNGPPCAHNLSGIESTAVRHGFVQKVYGILGMQLLVTTVIGGFVMSWGSTMMKSNPSLVMGLMVLSLVATCSTMCVFTCCPDTMRKTPTNYIVLTIFTLAEAVMVGFISSTYTKESVLMVLAVTVLVALGLTLFACQTTYDITGLMPYFVALSMVLCGFGMVLWIGSMCGLAGSPAFQGMRLLYAFGGALLFSGFIVLDTQMIVGGKHSKYSFSLDDYCMAAISLYLDIIQLFLFLLELLGDRNR
eukprot:TRINITY_DN13082_c0_g1_i1.p1 TRINITY_DN13082_c0_g1~~TRINITY_DN13082_c0_g1_i1.p1  ORF type:complete len:261 (+),score=52.25 TRINITY_DN13082_c0_g1_i1:67-849(+)